jgi:hypothetical protein
MSPAARVAEPTRTERRLWCDRPTINPPFPFARQSHHADSSGPLDKDTHRATNSITEDGRRTPPDLFPGMRSLRSRSGHFGNTRRSTSRPRSPLPLHCEPRAGLASHQGPTSLQRCVASTSKGRPWPRSRSRLGSPTGSPGRSPEMAGGLRAPSGVSWSLGAYPRLRAQLSLRFLDLIIQAKG